MSIFLQEAIRRFQEYKRLAEKGMAQLSDEALLAPTGDDNNSIVIIVKHLQGNMLSRWTAFLTEDGEKPWRQRDDEFEHETLGREKLMERWEEGWAALFGALGSLTDEDLSRTIHIRGEGMPAMSAIMRQLMHYSYHVGQIVLLCKQAQGNAWQSLSVPRGGTAAFNAAMFAQQASVDSNR